MPIIVLPAQILEYSADEVVPSIL